MVEESRALHLFRTWLMLLKTVVKIFVQYSNCYKQKMVQPRCCSPGPEETCLREEAKSIIVQMLICYVWILVMPSPLINIISTSFRSWRCLLHESWLWHRQKRSPSRQWSPAALAVHRSSLEYHDEEAVSLLALPMSRTIRIVACQHCLKLCPRIGLKAGFDLRA